MKYVPIYLMLGYLLIAWFTFQVRHPKANQMTFYTYFGDVMTFSTVEELLGAAKVGVINYHRDSDY